ncbi:MAG: SUMF1/EgtB/PvdO family nonheme iron enzyme, partial [Salegentibacter sp.]
MMKDLSNLMPKLGNLKSLLLMCLVLLNSCKNGEKKEAVKAENASENISDIIVEVPENVEAPEGMVWIPGGKFMQGAVAGDKMAKKDEGPAHPVAVDGFFMDSTEVTNAEFAKFV